MRPEMSSRALSYTRVTKQPCKRHLFVHTHLNAWSNPVSHKAERLFYLQWSLFSRRLPWERTIFWDRNCSYVIFNRTHAAADLLDAARHAPCRSVYPGLRSVASSNMLHCIACHAQLSHTFIITNVIYAPRNATISELPNTIFYARQISSANLFCLHSILSNRGREGNLPLESSQVPI